MKYLLVLLVLAAGVAVYLIKKGKIKDTDGDLIPDVIEDKAEDIVKDVKAKAAAAKAKAKKIKEEVEDVVEEIQDVISAIKGKPTKSKLNSLTKQQLVDSAKADHGVELDVNTKKSTLVNKVYTIYNKK